MSNVTVNKNNLIDLIDYIIESEENHFQQYVCELYDDDFDVVDTEKLDAVLKNPKINHVYKTAMLLSNELDNQ